MRTKTLRIRVNGLVKNFIFRLAYIFIIYPLKRGFMQVKQVHQIMMRNASVFDRNINVESGKLQDIYAFKKHIPVLGGKTVIITTIDRRTNSVCAASYWDYSAFNCNIETTEQAVTILTNIKEVEIIKDIAKINEEDFEAIIRTYVALANNLITIQQQDDLIRQITNG